MINNRGQSLVLFVVVLPILFLLLVLVIDIGKMVVLKQELNNISEIVIDYGLDKIDIGIEKDDSNLDSATNDSNIDDTDEIVSNEELVKELREVVRLNDSEIDDVRIEIRDNKIYMELQEGVKLINIRIFSIKSSYVGYIDGDKKRIERISGDIDEYTKG